MSNKHEHSYFDGSNTKFENFCGHDPMENLGCCHHHTSLKPGEVFELVKPSKIKKISSNPKDLLGIKKVQLNLVPPSSIIYEALAFGDGARKYGPYNWRSNKVIASIYIAALMRHVLAWYDGEENATDSGLPHLAHAKACLGVLIDAMSTENLVDDRPPRGKASQLLDAFKEIDNE